VVHHELRHFAGAQRTFGRLVDAARAGQWDDPTPCDDWSVRDLVAHLVDEQLWVPPLLEGLTVAEIGQPYPGDDPLAAALDPAGDNGLADPDPRQAWHAAARASHAAFGEPGALDRTVHLSYGDRAAAGYCAEMTADLVVHAWDRGLGMEPEYDEDTVAEVYRQSEEQREALAASGMFKPPVEVPADAPVLDRLVALSGRDPGWRPA
jgi:uncharacterized protein (TIGR03086 family)